MKTVSGCFQTNGGLACLPACLVTLVKPRVVPQIFLNPPPPPSLFLVLSFESVALHRDHICFLLQFASSYIFGPAKEEERGSASI